MTRKKNEPAAAATAAKPSDLVADAVELSAARKQQTAADDTAWRRDTEAVYATLLLRADHPEPEDASELSHCLDDLKLRADHVRRDQAAIAEFRRQLSLHGSRADATESLVAAVEARKAMEKRHMQEMDHAIRACERARHHSSDCGRASSAMTVLEDKHPHLAAAFAALRASP